MVMGQGPQEPATLGRRMRTGARQAWEWVKYPFTTGAVRHERLVEQMRGLDGRAQVYGTAIEIMSAQISDIARDQQEILKRLDRHRDMFERVGASLVQLVVHADTASKVRAETTQSIADIRKRVTDGLAALQELASDRPALMEGLQRIEHSVTGEVATVQARLAALSTPDQLQQVLSEQIAALRARLESMPTTDQVQAISGGGAVLQDLASTRAQLTNELQKVLQVLAVYNVGVHNQLDSLPSVEQIRALLEGGVSARDLAALRGDLAGELEKLHDAVSGHVGGLHERLAVLPTADHVHGLIENGTIAQQLASTSAQTTGLHERMAALPTAEQINALVNAGNLAQELSSAWTQLVDGLQKVHDVVVEQGSKVSQQLAVLPSTEQVRTLVGDGTMVQELAATKSLLADGFQKVTGDVAEQGAQVVNRIGALPSSEQISALVNSGALAHELASARAHIGEGIQRVQQVLAEHSAVVHERLAKLPSTEQVHALVEGGTANSVQSTRKLVTEEALRGQAVAERTAARLEFLQSRSVIPLIAQGLVMCRNPLGFLAVPADDLVTLGAYADGVLPKQGSLKVVEKYLKAGATFVDVGAHVGLFSLLAARIVGPTGRVIAIEPVPATAAALRATINANGLSGVVTLVETAAGAERGLGTLSVEAAGGYSSLLPSETSANKVVANILPLDEILAGVVPDVVKIDVEGWEAKVIEGMHETLQANPNIILIMDFEPAHIRSTGLSSAAWVERIVGAGMKIFEIDERNGELSPLRKTGLEEIVSTNVLIARNDPSRRDALPGSEGWLWRGSGPPVLPAPRPQD